jgi:ribosome-associated protein
MNLEPTSDTQISSREKAEMLLRSALIKKAFNPVLVKLEKLTSLTDYFLIVSARSGKHVTSVAEAVLTEAVGRKFQRYSVEGVKHGNWALLDYGDVIVHIFQTTVREFYDLEGLWAEAPREVFSEDLSREIDDARKNHDEDD